MAELREIEKYASTLLDAAAFKDYAPNGIQVEGRAEVRKLVSGVTASLALLDQAQAWGADAVLVHHGYFWKGESPVLTGPKRKRLKLLLAHDISLLAYHLPLDAHPELGNNAQLAARLGWQIEGWFAGGVAAHGRTAAAVPLSEFSRHLAGVLGREPLTLGDPARRVERVAWCTGAAQDLFESAVDLGVDVFVTGEVSERTTHLARETGVAFIAAGHHATERYGVQALGGHLAERFGLDHRFVDVDNPV